MQTIVQLPLSNGAIEVYSPPPSGAAEKMEQILVGQHSEAVGMAADIGKPRRSILEALADFHLLTAEQITRLLFSPNSYAYVNKHLQYLVKQELVDTILPAKQTLYGRAPFVYVLSRKGRLLAKNLGFSVGKRYRSLKESTHKGYPVAHTLAVNEFLLKAVLLGKHHADITLRQFVHDKELFANPLKVQLPEEEKLSSLSPDLWLDIGQKGQRRRRYCFAVELNLTEINQKRWRETVRKYLYCLAAYKERFGTDIITVPISIQTWTDFPIKALESLTVHEWDERKREEKDRARRLQNLLHWTEAEVEAQHRMPDADLFCFSSAPLDQIAYTELFFSPHWVIPFQDTPRALLEPTGKGADGV